MTKFGKTTVADTFNAIHGYISSGHTGFTSTSTSTSNSIIHCGAAKAIGDYIDLQSITVDGTVFHDTDLSHGGNACPDANFGGTPMTRITVVGINSFNRRAEQPAGYTATPHVVFQFANIVYTHGMNSTDTNVGGYKECDLRACLVPVDSNYNSSSESGFGTAKAGSGMFLAALEDAGVPDSVLWAVPRVISHGAKSLDYNNTNLYPTYPATSVEEVEATPADTICDKLWIATIQEQAGGGYGFSFPTETAQNQALLEHYWNWALTTMYKYTISKVSGDRMPWYWYASPVAPNKMGNNADKFNVCWYGGATTIPATGVGYSNGPGVVPCFCVK
jgi:hypothetical protein